MTVALLELAEAAAREAGALLRQRPADLAVETKSTPTDVVTAMDTAVERLLVARLLADRPDDGVLGEEGAGVSGTSGVRWVLDPIDGTVNYLYDLPGYAVSVAAELDGETEVGVVYDVARDELYAARRGAGATRNGAPVRCSAQRELGQALVGTGFAYDAAVRATQAELLGRVLPRVRDIRRLGAAAVDLCAVACGRYDAFYEWGLQEWDLAAGGLIAREGGAVVRGRAGGVVRAAGPGLIDALDQLIGA